MTALILDKNMPLNQAIRYMKRLSAKGYDTYFKTISNKDSGTLEVHIIAENPYFDIIPIINEKGGKHNGK